LGFDFGFSIFELDAILWLLPSSTSTWHSLCWIHPKLFCAYFLSNSMLEKVYTEWGTYCTHAWHFLNHSNLINRTHISSQQQRNFFLKKNFTAGAYYFTVQATQRVSKYRPNHFDGYTVHSMDCVLLLLVGPVLGYSLSILYQKSAQFLSECERMWVSAQKCAQF
jgi:hypothetical protein